MGEIADEMLERYLSYEWDGLYELDDESYHAYAQDGFRRPDMPAIKPTDFPEPEELKNVCPFDP